MCPQPMPMMMTTTKNSSQAKKNKSFLLVEEIFSTVQGEGFFIGTPVSFVRLYWCPVGCDFCDQGWALKDAGTRSNPSRLMEINEIVDKVVQHNNQRIVISGGEPLFQAAVINLITALKLKNKLVHIETSGVSIALFNAPDGIDCLKGCWVTLSPKDKVTQHPKHRTSQKIWAIASEVKIVVQDGTELDYYSEQLKKVGSTIPVFLQPEWFNVQSTTKIAIELLQKYKDSHLNLRLGLQAHKFWDLP